MTRIFSPSRNYLSEEQYKIDTASEPFTVKTETEENFLYLSVYAIIYERCCNLL